MFYQYRCQPLLLVIPNKKKFGKSNDDEDGEESEETENAVAATPVDQETKEVVFIDDNGSAKMVEVKTGISDYENIEILEGLTISDRVVSGPFLVVSKRLEDGDAISSKDKKENKKEEPLEEAQASEE
ncbi:hypothetical protein [Fulvivirga aurantia]|uniref:hypothetical protein n=1 Tax=Fulvivirga aurantia TaxID=2529383 RepID=UPI0031B6293D